MRKFNLLFIGMILLLCGCSEKEDEIQYAPKDEVREDLFLKIPLR